MAKWFNKLGNVLDLVLASSCPMCQRSTVHEVCQDCQRRIQCCQLPSSQQVSQADLPMVAWGNYGGALKQAIATLKYNNHPRLARPLGHWLGQAWLTAPLTSRCPTIVPIPLHSTKRQQRGFNQAELLAQAFCELTGLPHSPHGLVRSRPTEAQFQLSPDARKENLAGAFQVGRFRRSPSTVLLIDDIYTTGATARAAMQVLRRHQISVCGLVVVAKAGLHSPP
jgi:ComF family protein